MIQQNCEFVILGGGCIGSAIFESLSQLGREVLLIDQGRKSVSATASSAGMVRVFHENTEHLKLALENMKIIPSLFNPSQAPGHLYFFSKKRREKYQANLSLMEKAHYPFEVLGHLEGQERFPDFRWQSDEMAIFEPLAHHIDPHHFSETLTRKGLERGGHLLDDFEITRICFHREDYYLSGPQGMIRARNLILSGGIRMIPLIQALGFSFPLEKRMIRYFIRQRIHRRSLPHFFDRETLQFARLGSEDTSFLSKHHIERLLFSLGEESITVEKEDCYTPHRSGIFGEISGHPGLFMATGWGGTGFKFSLAIGQRMSDLITRGNK